VAIALVTDSNAQLPRSLRERYRVRVVPLTVVVNGVAYREGEDLSNEWFYEALRAGAAVSTASASPGDLAATYAEAAADGAQAVLSIHVGSDLSATVGAARVAAAESPIPVEVLDSGTASFAIGCCVWAAGEALTGGGTLATAAASARRVAGRLGNVFMVRTLDLPRRGGRFAGDLMASALPVLALEGGAMRAVTEVSSGEEAVEVIVSYIADWAAAGEHLRVGVGDAQADDVATDLADRLGRIGVVDEVVRYEVGPSVAAHTGVGTFGAVFHAV
jgi:DegV family protein with EDD domain